MLNNTQEVAAQEEQLDARLAELLHLMHREHLANQETRSASLRRHVARGDVAECHGWSDRRAGTGVTVPHHR